MANVLDPIIGYLKRHFMVGLLLTNLMTFSVGLICNVSSSNWGWMAAVVGLGALAIFFMVVVALAWREDKQRLGLSEYSFGDVDRRKGLIALVSTSPTTSKEEVISCIDAIENGNDTLGLEKLYAIVGIGQTFRAIRHHIPKLERCWLLYTNDSRPNKEAIEHFLAKLCKGVRSEPMDPVLDPNDMSKVYKIVDRIYLKDIEAFGWDESDVIADITGGPKPMSSAVILACNCADRDMEYVEQKERQELIKINRV